MSFHVLSFPFLSFPFISKGIRGRVRAGRRQRGHRARLLRQVVQCGQQSEHQKLLWVPAELHLVLPPEHPHQPAPPVALPALRDASDSGRGQGACAAVTGYGRIGQAGLGTSAQPGADGIRIGQSGVGSRDHEGRAPVRS
eukprot:scaffold2660_cov257-Pinguiococcus_pyrenoidosus.AAC.21